MADGGGQRRLHLSVFWLDASMLRCFVLRAGIGAGWDAGSCGAGEQQPTCFTNESARRVFRPCPLASREREPPGSPQGCADRKYHPSSAESTTRR